MNAYSWMVMGVCGWVWTAGAAFPGEAEEGPGKGPDVRVFANDPFEVVAIADRRQVVAADANPALFLSANPGLTPEVWKAALPDGEGEVELSVNVFAVRLARPQSAPDFPDLDRLKDRLVLVDAGLGSANGGQAYARMVGAGIDPAGVTDVLLTHAHGDHVGGLLEGGRPAFPRATVWIAKPEYDYWHDDAARDALPEAKRGNFALARAALAAYGGRLRVFAPESRREDDIRIDVSGEPPLYAMIFPGHTPGHTLYLAPKVSRNALVFWGDLMHRVDIQSRRPDWAVAYDVDPVRAVASRRLFFRIADMERRGDGTMDVAGAHLPFPGLGDFPRDGDGYRFVPADPDAPEAE